MTRGMSEITTIATLQLSRTGQSVPDSAPQRHYAMLVFVCLSLSMPLIDLGTRVLRGFGVQKMIVR